MQWIIFLDKISKKPAMCRHAADFKSCMCRSNACTAPVGGGDWALALANWRAARLLPIRALTSAIHHWSAKLSKNKDLVDRRQIQIWPSQKLTGLFLGVWNETRPPDLCRGISGSLGTHNFQMLVFGWSLARNPRNGTVNIPCHIQMRLPSSHWLA